MRNLQAKPLQGMYWPTEASENYLRSGFVRALALSLYFPLTFPLCNRFWIRERFKINKKLAKLGDAISISKSETINDSLTDSLTH